MADYRKKATGTIYHVTNEALIPSYEGNEAFEKVVAKPVEAKKETKATVKKK